MTWGELPWSCVPLVVLFAYLFGRWARAHHGKHTCPSCSHSSRSHKAELFGPDTQAMLGYDAEFTCERCARVWTEGEGH